MFTSRLHGGRLLALAMGICVVGASSVEASPYTVAYTDGGSWNQVYAQGFSTSLGATPDPGAGPVYLNQFEFFKGGSADSGTNIQLAIFNTMYPNLTGLTTASSSFVGLSTNTIATTSTIALGAPIAFNFNSLPLTYGSDYSAVYVNVGAGGAITPVLAPSLTANYAVQSDSNFHPVTNYGTESQFQYTTTNFINNGFFSAFSYAGDANFSASLSTTPTPEPACLTLGVLGLAALGSRRRLSR